MNPIEIQGNWDITKNRMKQKWASLTDDDLAYSTGQFENMIGRILTRDLRAARNCHVDVTLKDVETVQGDPDRVVFLDNDPGRRGGLFDLGNNLYSFFTILRTSKHNCINNF